MSFSGTEVAVRQSHHPWPPGLPVLQHSRVCLHRGTWRGPLLYGGGSANTGVSLPWVRTWRCTRLPCWGQKIPKPISRQSLISKSTMEQTHNFQPIGCLKKIEKSIPDSHLRITTQLQYTKFNKPKLCEGGKEGKQETHTDDNTMCKREKLRLNFWSAREGTNDKGCFKF